MMIRVIGSSLIAVFFILPMLGIPWQFTPQWEFYLASVVQFGFGYSFYTGSYRALKRGRADMDVLVALGTTAAYGYSAWAVFIGTGYLYFETSVVLIALILLGRLMENRSKKAARSGMQTLLKKQSRIARIKKDGVWTSLPIDQVKKGDWVQVLPGEAFPVDGEILSGQTTVDESMMSGEVEPVVKKEGSQVIAGTINGGGAVELRTCRVGAGTALGRMIRLVEEAAASKAPVQKLADRVSAYFVPGVILVALITFFLWWLLGNNMSEGVMQAVAVLVVACPCALGLATPMVLVVVLAACAKKGILIKNAEGLQHCSTLQMILFDKTGTVTEGVLRVKKAEGNLNIGGALARYSTHPLSQAIIQYLNGQSISYPEMQGIQAVAGKGITGELEGKRYFLGSEAYLKENHIPVQLPTEEGIVVCFGNLETQGYFVFSDPLRKGLVDVVSSLKKLGIKVGIVSGDRKKNVEKIAGEIGIDAWFAEVLPEDKAKLIKQYQEEGKSVGMVGDGINDAPALALADVGFAIGSGTDVAMESASIGLIGGSIDGVPTTVIIARRALQTIKQNLFFAFFYNGIGIPVAAFGLLNPMIAGVAMALSSVSVVFNALLLRRALDKPM